MVSVPACPVTLTSVESNHFRTHLTQTSPKDARNRSAAFRNMFQHVLMCLHHGYRLQMRLISAHIGGPFCFRLRRVLRNRNFYNDFGLVCTQTDFSDVVYRKATTQSLLFFFFFYLKKINTKTAPPGDTPGRTQRIGVSHTDSRNSQRRARHNISIIPNLFCIEYTVSMNIKHFVYSPPS